MLLDFGFEVTGCIWLMITIVSTLQSSSTFVQRWHIYICIFLGFPLSMYVEASQSSGEVLTLSVSSFSSLSEANLIVMMLNKSQMLNVKELHWLTALFSLLRIS